MPTFNANAEWKGNLKEGNGQMEFGSGAFKGEFTFKTRFEGGEGTSPEELIGAAHSGCFSMAFSNELAKAGFEPTSVNTTAEVHLTMDDGPNISKIVLTCDAVVPEISDDKFQEIAEGAKKGCPVSKALGGVGTIELNATLK
jgi:osmotically inducible protein OsmC